MNWPWCPITPPVVLTPEGPPYQKYLQISPLQVKDVPAPVRPPFISWVALAWGALAERYAAVGVPLSVTVNTVTCLNLDAMMAACAVSDDLDIVVGFMEAINAIAPQYVQRNWSPLPSFTPANYLDVLGCIEALQFFIRPIETNSLTTKTPNRCIGGAPIAQWELPRSFQCNPVIDWRLTSSTATMGDVSLDLNMVSWLWDEKNNIPFTDYPNAIAYTPCSGGVMWIPYLMGTGQAYSTRTAILNLEFFAGQIEKNAEYDYFLTGTPLPPVGNSSWMSSHIDSQAPEMEQISLSSFNSDAVPPFRKEQVKFILNGYELPSEFIAPLKVTGFIRSGDNTLTVNYGGHFYWKAIYLLEVIYLRDGGSPPNVFAYKNRCFRRIGKKPWGFEQACRTASASWSANGLVAPRFTNLSAGALSVPEPRISARPEMAYRTDTITVRVLAPDDASPSVTVDAVYSVWLDAHQSTQYDVRLYSGPFTQEKMELTWTIPDVYNIFWVTIKATYDTGASVIVEIPILGKRFCGLPNLDGGLDIVYPHRV